MTRSSLAAGFELVGVVLIVWAGLWPGQVRAWQPALAPDGSLVLASGGPVRPGETGVVGVVGFGTHLVQGEVALTMQAMDAYLASSDGYRIPIDRLEWAFRRYPADPLNFQPLRTGSVTVYRAAGGWAGDLIWRFRPVWGDRASSAPYEVAIAYTISPTSVDHSPVVVLPNPYRLGSGESLDFYVYRPASGLVSVAAWPQSRGPCDTAPGFNRGRVYPVQPGWNRLRWWPYESGFPVFKTGIYCYAVSGNIAGPMIGGGSFEVTDASAAQNLRVAVTGEPDGRPLPGALLELASAGRMPGRAAKTGPDGTASFAGLEPGQYVLAAHAAGYQSVSRPLTVEAAADGEGQLVRVHLPAAPLARLYVSLTAASARGRPRVGDIVTVEVRVGFPPVGASGRARVEVDMGPALAVLPGSWSVEPGGGGFRVNWRPPRLVWELEQVEGLDVAVMKAQAVVTPLAAGQGTVSVRAQGWIDAVGRRASIEGATASVDLDAAGSEAMGLVVGAIRGPGDHTSAGGPMAVVAEDGTYAAVDRHGYFTMTLSAGVHVLRVRKPAPGRAPAGIWGAPAVLVVRPGTVVPVRLDAPRASFRSAGSGPAVGIVAAGKVDWVYGGPADASGGVTLHVAGRSFDAVASAAASNVRLHLASVAVRAGDHLLLIGDLARHVDVSGTTPTARDPVASEKGIASDERSPVGERAPLAHLSLGRDAGLSARGALWRWHSSDSRIMAFWSSAASDQQSAGIVPLGVVQAVTTTRDSFVWAGVRVDGPSEPSEADNRQPSWVLGAGWDGRLGDERVVAEFVQGWQGGGWGLSVLREDTAVTVRRLQGTVARRLAGDGPGPMLASEGELTDLEWRTTSEALGGVVRSLGFGARLGSGADLYTLTELVWPRLPVPDPAGIRRGSAGAAVVSARFGGIVKDATENAGSDTGSGTGRSTTVGSPGVHPYLRAALTAPQMRAGPVKGSAGMTFWAAGRRLVGLEPWKAWADLSTRLSDGLEVGVKASLQPDGNAPLLRLQGDVRPDGPVRLSSRAVAAPGTVAWEEVAVVYERDATRAELRLKPDRLEALAAVTYPAADAAAAGDDGDGGSRWRLSGSLRWPVGSSTVTRRVALSGSWTRGPALAAAQLDLDGAAYEMSASLWLDGPQREGLTPGVGSGLYGTLSWRGVPAPAPFVRVDTLQLRLGTRRAIGTHWGWFAEGQHHLVMARRDSPADSPELAAFRGVAGAAGVYFSIPGDAGGTLVETGWRAASYGLPGTVVEQLGPSLRPGWFVRLSGWWTPLPAAATICRDP